MKKLFALSFIVLALLGSLFFINSQNKTEALTASDFVAGNIMSDLVMTNKNSMSVSQIQTFLNSKVPTCDTQGLQTSEFGAGDADGDGVYNTQADINLADYNDDGRIQRWEWAKVKGYSPPFTCLKSYSENGKTSAQIIYEAAQEFSINPQVLIVLLQKEQALITDTWPIPGSSQYKTATGYGCPDTAPCDAEYFGLTNQLRWSSRMFRAILNNSPTWYTPYLTGTNYIQFNPSTSCGGSNVTIRNRTTQALYNYTPYQPNNETLSWKFNGGAYPSSCGAYGNLNFFVYFSEWFGSTQGVRIIPVTYDSTTDKTGEPALIGFKLSSRPTSPVTIVFKVSSPSNGEVVGNGTIVFNSENWDKPNLNTIRIKGKNNTDLVGNYRYWLIPWSIASQDIRYNNLSSIFRGNASILHQDTSSAPAVYRMASSETDKYYFTSSTSERGERTAEGWVDQGVNFYFCQSGEQLVHRMTNGEERRLAVEGSGTYAALATQGYRVESPVFSVSNQGNVPIYWLYDSANKRSIYSINPNEGAAAGFINKGVAFNTCDSSDNQAVYRLVNTETGDRLYTTSATERDRALYERRYRYEQLAFYTCADGEVNVYRLVSKTNGDRLYTSSATERDRAVSSYNYRDEGVGFKIP